MLKVGMKKSGQKRTIEINKQLMKEEFIIFVLGIPTFFFIALGIGAYFDKEFTIKMWLLTAMGIFIGMLIMWTIIHTKSYIEEKRIGKEIGWK